MRSPVSSGRTGIKSPKSKLRGVFPGLDLTGEHGFMFRRVVLESPLAGYGTPFAGQLVENIRYVRACIRNCYRAAKRRSPRTSSMHNPAS